MWLEYCWESRNPEHCSRKTCQISGIKNVVLTYFVLTLNPSVPHSSVFIVKFGNLLAEAYSALPQTSKRRVCNSSDQQNAVPHCFKFQLRKYWIPAEQQLPAFKSVFYFYTPWKSQKTSHSFRGYRYGTLDIWNG